MGELSHLGLLVLVVFTDDHHLRSLRQVTRGQERFSHLDVAMEHRGGLQIGRIDFSLVQLLDYGNCLGPSVRLPILRLGLALQHGGSLALRRDNKRVLGFRLDSGRFLWELGLGWRLVGVLIKFCRGENRFQKF
jgi:hypothetical protein